MSVTGIDGRFLRINGAYCLMLGYQPGDLVGASFSDFTHPDDRSEDLVFVAAAIAGSRDSSDREKRYVRKDGSIVWSRVRAEIVRDETGDPLYFVSHLQDITERRAAQTRMRESERTLRSVIDSTPALICVKGRDHRYQLVNREFERVYGVSRDRIIGRSDAEIVPAARLESARSKDRLVLDGGLPSQEKETISLGGEERVFLRTRFPLLDENGKIHAVCIASTDITQQHRDELVKRARLQCSEQIYSALAQDRFVLHGQPMFNLASMQPAGVELLLRMRAVRGGEELLAPGAFLPAAERFDLIQAVDEWVIDRALEFAAAGHRVNVNVSAKTISDSRQVDRIEQAIAASGVAAKNVVFEITETAVADNLEAARMFVTRLREQGCAIALDDFGVGHGTFTYLRHFVIDYLKIDMEFIRDLLTDDESRRVVQAIVGVARQFKIETIAEGVENQATLDELRRLGVDYAQGFWTGRPAPLPPAWNQRPPPGDPGATGHK